MNILRHHLPSPALIVACVGLIFALGGVSYAAGMLPKNSVGTVQLKKRAVTGGKLSKSAVTGAKVKNGTLMAADFKAGQLPAGSQGAKGDTGIQGPKGDSGIPGPKGEKGDPGATHVTRRSNPGAPKGPGDASVALAGCQPGETLVGGGAIPDWAGAAKPTLVESGPVSANSWRVSFRNDAAAGTVTAVAYALCASP